MAIPFIEMNKLAFFADTSSLTSQVTQIVQFCTTNDTTTSNYDLVDTRAMNREGSFNANAVGNTTNGEVFTYARAAAGNYNAFKQLNTFTAAFNNLAVNLYGVTSFKIRDVAAQLFLFQYFNNVHFFLLKS